VLEAVVQALLVETEVDQLAGRGETENQMQLPA
jgi:hypothetical protein